MRAELRSLSSTDSDDLRHFTPSGPFAISIFAMVGAEGAPGEDLFQLVVCTPGWFADNMKEHVATGRHFLFVKDYDYGEIESFVSDYCRRCEGASWAEVAAKVGRLAAWEFEDYQPLVSD